jgi:fucose permease
MQPIDAEPLVLHGPQHQWSTRVQFALLLSLFVLWGACNSLNDVLIQSFKTALSLSDTLSSLVQTAFYVGYMLGSLPAAFIARRFGYKTCVISGLGLVCTGAASFWPCSRGDHPSYALLLLCLYLLAFGLAFLECSANPWVVLIGERWRAGCGTAALNLAQSFNPLGSLGGVFLGRQMILTCSPAQRVRAVGRLYAALAAVFAAVALAFALVRFAAGDKPTRRAPVRCGLVRATVARRWYALGVGAQGWLEHVLRSSTAGREYFVNMQVLCGHAGSDRILA